MCCNPNQLMQWLQHVIGTWLGKSAPKEGAFLLQLVSHKTDSTEALFVCH